MYLKRLLAFLCCFTLTSKSLKNSDGFPELLAVTCTGQNLAVIEKNSQLCTNGQKQLFLELLHRAVQ